MGASAVLLNIPQLPLLRLLRASSQVQGALSEWWEWLIFGIFWFLVTYYSKITMTCIPDLGAQRKSTATLQFLILNKTYLNIRVSFQTKPLISGILEKHAWYRAAAWGSLHSWQVDEVMSPPADLFAPSSYAILKLYVHYEEGWSWGPLRNYGSPRNKRDDWDDAWIDLRSSNLRWLSTVCCSLESLASIWHSTGKLHSQMLVRIPAMDVYLFNNGYCVHIHNHIFIFNHLIDTSPW